MLRFLKKNEYKVNRMSVSFRNRENSVVDEPRREKTGPRDSLWGVGVGVGHRAACTVSQKRDN